MAPIVCMVTDRARLGGDFDRLVRRVAAAARGGAHLIQVRERELDGGPLCAFVRRCLEAVRDTPARVVVNDRLDVALAAGAHGVHLRADSVPVGRVRAMTPPGFLVGRSVHSVAAARRATDEHADYLIAGNLFPTSSKPGRPGAGIALLEAVAGAVPCPVLAIGGITVETARGLARTGAAGFAAIGLFADASDEDIASVIARASEAFGCQ
jgi:thiamine-phosphate diphosphorylase